MRCDDVRDRLDILWEGRQPAEVLEHVRQCPSCSQYQRDLRLVRAGFQLWKREEPVEASLGFAERVVRQLSELSKTPGVSDFFERVGRRFVYATLVLTLLALLALTLPSAGPVRGLGAADIQISAQEASLAYSDPIGETGVQESPDMAPAEAPSPAVMNEVK
jgi:hypothetical protein